MPRTLKRTTIALTDENWRQLEILMHRLGENRSEVMKRAITILFNEMGKWDKKTIKITEEK